MTDQLIIDGIELTVGNIENKKNIGQWNEGADVKVEGKDLGILMSDPMFAVVLLGVISRHFAGEGYRTDLFEVNDISKGVVKFDLRKVNIRE